MRKQRKKKSKTVTREVNQQQSTKSTERKEIPTPPPNVGGFVQPPGMGPPPGRFPLPMRGPMPPPGMFPHPGYPGYPLAPPPMMRPMGERPELEGQPPIKKQKTEGIMGGQLIPEKEWLETHPGTHLIIIQTPNLQDKSTWSLRGQLLRIQCLMSEKVKDLKDKIAEQVGGLPANKQKLKGNIGFWKDNKTLAYYNATNSMTLELGIKERGGRR